MPKPPLQLESYLDCDHPPTWVVAIDEAKLEKPAGVTGTGCFWGCAVCGVWMMQFEQDQLSPQALQERADHWNQLHAGLNLRDRRRRMMGRKTSEERIREWRAYEERHAV